MIFLIVGYNKVDITKGFIKVAQELRKQSFVCQQLPVPWEQRPHRTINHKGPLHQTKSHLFLLQLPTSCAQSRYKMTKQLYGGGVYGKNTFEIIENHNSIERLICGCWQCRYCHTPTWSKGDRNIWNTAWLRDTVNQTSMRNVNEKN